MIARLREESVSNSDLLSILEAVQDMLVVLDDDAKNWNETHSTDVPTSSTFLGVTQQPKRRRKSSGNIARNLGADLY